jgi:TonB family protein
MLSKDAVRQQAWAVQVIRRLISLTILFIAAGTLMAQAPGADRHGATEQVCQLISTNPRDFHPYQFVPAVVDDKRFKNRRPKVAYVVNEDGSVSNVKVLKGTGSPTVDAGLVKSIQAWKYKSQPGCMVETSMVVTIDIR